MTGRSDVELMLALKAGDEDAFTELVDRHRDAVVNLTHRYLGNKSDAEDLAQEVFLKVYRARRSRLREALKDFSERVLEGKRGARATIRCATERINTDPYGSWIYKLEVSAPPAGLLDAAAYRARLS